jgi:hypothetical protein
MLMAGTSATNVAIRRVLPNQNTSANAQIVESWFRLVLWWQVEISLFITLGCWSEVKRVRP